jgi:hypothetical protein
MPQKKGRPEGRPIAIHRKVDQNFFVTCSEYSRGGAIIP